MAQGRKTTEKILEGIESRHRVNLQTREVVLPAKDSAVQDWVTAHRRSAQREVFAPGQTSLIESPQPMRESHSVEVSKCIYTRLGWPARNGGLERAFIHWAQADPQVQAFCKISENRHTFVRLRYVKDDGLPAFYSPDFLVRTADAVYLAETKAQAPTIHPNVQRKRKAALALRAAGRTAGLCTPTTTCRCAFASATHLVTNQALSKLTVEILPAPRNIHPPPC